MRFEDVKIGQKVVPFNKTVGQTGLENSHMWRIASEAKQNFLYVADIDSISKRIYLSHDGDERNGDLFSSEDFKIYFENNEEYINFYKEKYEESKLELDDYISFTENELKNYINLQFKPVDDKIDIDISLSSIDFKIKNETIILHYDRYKKSFRLMYDTNPIDFDREEDLNSLLKFDLLSFLTKEIYHKQKFYDKIKAIYDKIVNLQTIMIQYVIDETDFKSKIS